MHISFFFLLPPFFNSTKLFQFCEQKKVIEVKQSILAPSFSDFFDNPVTLNNPLVKKEGGKIKRIHPIIQA